VICAAAMEILAETQVSCFQQLRPGLVRIAGTQNVMAVHVWIRCRQAGFRPNSSAELFFGGRSCV
jgi:hypothetical protein